MVNKRAHQDGRIEPAGRRAARTPRMVPPSHLIVPAVYRCRLTHARLAGVRHSFGYTVYLWLTDVDDLPRLRWPMTRLAGFDARDHLGSPDRSLRANLDAYLEGRGIWLKGGRILMFAQPRGLGYAFDPVSLFFCYYADETPACVVVEVRNTFGERHCYLVRADATSGEIPKHLYVSPFFPADGYYKMRLALSETGLLAAITLYRQSRPGNGAQPPGVRASRPVLAAVLAGAPIKSPASLARSLLRPGRVLAAYRTITLIHWQGRRLRARGLTPARRRYHQATARRDGP
jgi:DUF1365 family protein